MQKKTQRPHGSQNLGDIDASLRHRQSGTGSGTLNPGQPGFPVARTSNVNAIVKAGEAGPTVLTRRESITTGSDLGPALKAWEEPIPPESQSALFTRSSSVRLPGLLLIDEDDREKLLENEVRAKELVNYLREKWKLEIEERSSLIEINYRTVEMLIHKPPTNHWLLKRARQKIAENTGFFSNVAKQFEFLGKLR